MIQCDKARELLSLQLDDELNRAEQDQLEEHLDSCPSCQQYAKQLHSLHHKLLQLPDIPLGNSMVEELLNKDLFNDKEEEFDDYHVFGKRNKPIIRWRSWQGLAVAALIILISIPTIPYLYQQKDNVAESQSQQNLAADSVQTRALNKKAIYDNDQNKVKYNATVLNDDTKQSLDHPKLESYSIMFTQAVGQIYIILEVNHQLKIYQNNIEVFQTERWDEDLSAKWQVDKERQTIHYQIYKDDHLVSEHQINIIEKKDSIIK